MEKIMLFRSENLMPGGRTQPQGDRVPLTGTADEQAADLRAYAEAGLDEFMLSLPARTMEELLGRLRQFMREVATRV
jgi:hypothetical protein